MNVMVHGGDLPGLKKLTAMLDDANRSVLIGVPAGDMDDGASHTRSEKGRKKLTKRLDGVRRRMAARDAGAFRNEVARIAGSEARRASATAQRDRRQYRRAYQGYVAGEARRARTSAMREFKRSTIGSAEDYQGSGALAGSMRRKGAVAAREARVRAKEAGIAWVPRRLARSSRGEIAARMNWVAKGSKQSVSDAVPSAMIAAVHEFGYPKKGIPERSFLRGGILRARPKLQRLNEASLKAVLRGGMTISRALGLLGNVAVGEVKREFVVGKFALLKQATIDKKGSSRPLVDTGQLRQSITYQIEGTQSENAKVIG